MAKKRKHLTFRGLRGCVRVSGQFWHADRRGGATCNVARTAPPSRRRPPRDRARHLPPPRHLVSERRPRRGPPRRHRAAVRRPRGALPARSRSLDHIPFTRGRGPLARRPTRSEEPPWPSPPPARRRRDVPTGDATAMLPLPGDAGEPITVIGTPTIRGGFDDVCLKQAINSRMAPGVDHLVLNPDAHLGYGAPVGCTMSSRTHIYPGPVGFDIKCSMSLLQLDLPEEAVADKKVRLCAHRRHLRAHAHRHGPRASGRARRSRRVHEQIGRIVATEGASKQVCELLGVPRAWRHRCEDSFHVGHDGTAEALRVPARRPDRLRLVPQLRQQGDAAGQLRRRQPLRRVRGGRGRRRRAGSGRRQLRSAGRAGRLPLALRLPRLRPPPAQGRFDAMECSSTRGASRTRGGDKQLCTRRWAPTTPTTTSTTWPSAATSRR